MSFGFGEEVFFYLETLYGITRSSEDLLDMDILAQRLGITVHEISTSKRCKGYHRREEGRDHIFLSKHLGRHRKITTFYYELGYVLAERVSRKKGSKLSSSVLRLLHLRLDLITPLAGEMEFVVRKRYPNVKSRTVKRLKRRFAKVWSLRDRMKTVEIDMEAGSFCYDVVAFMSQVELRRGRADRAMQLQEAKYELLDHMVSRFVRVSADFLEGYWLVLECVELLRLAGLRRSLNHFAMLKERVSSDMNVLLGRLLKSSTIVWLFFIVHLVRGFTNPHLARYLVDKQFFEAYEKLCSSGKGSYERSV